MHFSSYHYFPVPWPVMLGLFILFIIAVALIELYILKYAYQRMGIPPRYVLLVLLASLIGSQINIPVYELPPEKVESDKIVVFNGMQYKIPEVENWPGTIIAVNIGGALIPFCLSIYLWVKNRLYVAGIVGTAIVAVVVHLLASPVKGVGITVPIFIPPVVAAIVALALAWRKAPPLAYIVGSMGTLIGADLSNLGNIQGLGAPIASIGGAGTFDGIFVTGVLAVLLAPVTAPAERRYPEDDDSEPVYSHKGTGSDVPTSR